MIKSRSRKNTETWPFCLSRSRLGRMVTKSRSRWSRRPSLDQSLGIFTIHFEKIFEVSNFFLCKTSSNFCRASRGAILHPCLYQKPEIFWQK